jgi:hypothetical protein
MPRNSRGNLTAPNFVPSAIAEARNPLLSAEKCQWWYWSRRRKESHAKK